MCGGGFFKDLIILVIGVIGIGKIFLVSKFIEDGCMNNEFVMFFVYEEFWV